MKNLLGIVGFILAGICFFAWYGNNEGKYIQSMTTLSDSSTLPESGNFDVARVYGGRSFEAPEGNTNRSSTQKPERSEANVLGAVTPITSTSKSQMQRGIQNLADAAMAQAIDKRKQIPAGASLALLIYSAERGKELTANNLSRVTDYLLGVKYDASESDRSKYFKYASNSEKWFQGLGLERNGGHPTAELERIYQRYNLQQYDDNVYAYVVNPESSKLKFDKIIKPETTAPAAVGDATKEDVRRNHAFAKNRWVEKESAGTEASVKFLPAEEIPGNALSEARYLVESLQMGESISFDNPTEYYAAVREVIAMEAGYNTWNDYESAIGKSKAKKIFGKRAEKGGFMATGTLQVTREK